MSATESPFPQYFDLDGTPLNNGSLFFGVANQNPETNQITVYWDDALTQPASQPIQTINGYAVRNGTPALLFANVDYSITVRNLRGSMVFTAANSSTFSNSSSLRADLANSSSATKGSSLIGFLQVGTGAVGRTVQAKLRETFSVKDFGAVGDGVADDTLAIQAALNACALQRSSRLEFPSGTYLISSELLIRNGAQTTSSDVGSDIHFMPDQNRLIINSDAHAKIKATAAMTSMLRFSPTTVGGLGSYANFYSEIRGLLLDGNSLAGIGIYIDSAMHVKITSNAITGVTTGIFNTGYGVHDINYNVIRATVCISYTGGGDSMFEHNDLFIATGGSGVLLRPFAGSTLIHRNTYTPQNTTISDTGTKGIELRADGVGEDVKVLGAIKIIANCFDGMRYGVYGRGFSAAVINVKSIEIASNYIGAAGSSVTCDLVDFAFATGLNIHDNDITPGMSDPRVRSLGTLFTVKYSTVHHNNIYACNADGLLLDGVCNNVFVDENKFNNVSVGATTGAFVRVQGTSDTNFIRRNVFTQTDATGAVNGVVEQGSADRTYADYNEMYSLISVEYTKVGANSVMKSRLRQAAAPASGTWLAGAITEYPSPVAGGFIGSVCTTGGTPGTWKTFAAISA